MNHAFGWITAAICTTCVVASFALPSPAPTRYRVELDVYVQDARTLCTQAWGIALPEHGPAITEMVTMTRGEFDSAKCLAVVFQKLPAVGVVRAGIYVTERP